MRNMKNLLKYTLITTIFVGGVACTNLDEKLPGAYTQTFTPSNPGFGVPTNVNTAQPLDGLQAAFNGLLSGTATNGGFFAVQEGGTDEAVITQKGGDWYDGGLYIKIHQHQFSATTWAINDTWNQQYNGIFQCNTLLASITDPLKVAQLRFLRAYYYWRLMDVFGNIKIVTTAGVDAPQGTRLAAYTFIESELLAALTNLPDGRQAYGRASKSAAHALLSRLYLNALVYTGTQQYAKAITEADAVITSGIYSLDANYASVFAPDNINPSEMIFTVPFDQTTGQGATWPHMTLHYPSQLTFQLSAQPWNGFSTLEDFYNSYDPADKRRAANFISGPQYYPDGVTPVLDIAYDKADPDGAPLNFTPHINMLYPNASRQGGARFGKFSIKTYQLTNADNDYPILRLGEVILNKAEAMSRLANDWTAGAALIKQITDRAGAPTAPATAAGYLAERGREMFIESIRRTDMIRFGAYFGTWWENPGDPDPANHGLMAIPTEQIQAALGTANPLTQNPGY